MEEPQTETDTLFSNWLTTEANEANKIKNETPVMCVIGNPPYSGISSNNGDWISSLIDDYKYVDGVHFNEKKHWLNDDYVKFIRYGQHFIEKNGSGILAFINPHGFLDNPTSRGMRWNLLKTFDKIYTIDLHGNTKKKEKAPDGGIDENVFDIQQGVSINIFVKTGKKDSDKLGSVIQLDLFGSRESKYTVLNNTDLNELIFEELLVESPNFFFVKKDITIEKLYSQGLKLTDLFINHALGMMTGKDELLTNIDSSSLQKFINGIRTFDKSKIEETNYFKWSWVVDYIENNRLRLLTKIRQVQYRPFDKRYVIYDNKLLQRDLFSIQKNYFQANIGLIFCRQGIASNTDAWESIFLTNLMSDINIFRRGGGTNFPLYTYQDSKGQEKIEITEERTPNLNTDILKQIAEKLGLAFTNEKNPTNNTFAPIDLLDYIYAVLHSPAYREKYKEFLKIDFPRVPYPKDADSFWKLVKKGKAIRELHLLEGPLLEQRITQYPIAGTNQVGKVRYEDEKVYINESQYFSNVPQIAWDFYIGGYQPAQKWLKDRKDRTLNFEDINHYQYIIIALTETSRLMKEIDDLGMEW